MLLTVQADGTTVLDTNGVFWPTNQSSNGRTSAPLPSGITVADAQGATTIANVEASADPLWFESDAPFRNQSPTTSLPSDDPAFAGLPGGISVDATCSTPFYTRVELSNDLDRTVEFDLLTWEFDGVENTVSRRVSLAAGETREIFDYERTSEVYASYQVLVEDRYEVASTSSNAIPSCYLPQMELRALSSTHESSLFGVVNNNDVAVDYQLSTSESLLDERIPANSSREYRFPYGERVRLLLNGISAASVPANIEVLDPDFKAKLDIVGICRTADEARFRVTNNNDEFVELTIAPELTVIPVNAGETKEFVVNYEPRVSVLIKEANYGIVESSTETCASDFDLTVNEGCFFDSATTPRAFIPVVNNGDQDLRVKIQSLENQSVQTEFQTVFEASETVFQLFLESVAPGTEARLIIEATDGSGDTVEGPTFTLPTQSCG
jgi:hypothetical protein